MAHYRLVTPQGHFAPGTVVTDTDEDAGPFRIAPQTAQRLLAAGALVLADEPPPAADEPGWRTDAPAAMASEQVPPVRTPRAKRGAPKE